MNRLNTYSILILLNTLLLSGVVSSQNATYGVNPLINCALDPEVDNDPAACSANLVVNSPTVSGVGISALEFDGSNDYIALDLFETGANSLAELTAEAWIRTTWTGSDFGNWSILDFDRSEFFNVYITGSGQLGFSTMASGSSIHDMFSGSAGLLNDGNWHHIAAVYDGVDKIAYADGVEIGRVTNAHSGLALGNSDTRFAFIGEGSEASTFNGVRNSYYYSGSLDDVRYWNTARSEADILGNMYSTLTGSETDLVAYYDFQDGSGSSILTDKADSNRGANDGVLYNMDIINDWLEINYSDLYELTNSYNGTDDASGVYPIGTTTITWTIGDHLGNSETCIQTIIVNDSEGPNITCSGAITVSHDPGQCSADIIVPIPVFNDNCASALSFDGTNDYVALNLFESGSNSIPEFTVEAWVNTTFSASSYSSNWAIFDFDRSEFFNFYVTGSGQLGFSTSATGSSIQDMTSGSVGELNDGEWHHVVAVYDGTDKIAYIDGVEVNRIVNAHSGLALGTANTRYAFIGDGSEATSYNGSRNSIYYEGSIDELRYWETVRTVGEINTHMNSVLTGAELDLIAYYDFNDGIGSSFLADKASSNRGANNGELINMNTSTAWIPEVNSNLSPLTNDFNGTDDASGEYPVGTTLVTWTIEDGSGNSNTCSQLITVTSLDCDDDGYTDIEETTGICGYVGDPTDVNSPFEFQETLTSGDSDDNIFSLRSIGSAQVLNIGDQSHLTIKDGHHLKLEGDIELRDLLIETNASIDLNGFSLILRGNLIVNGDLIPNLGHIVLNDDCEARFIGGISTIEIHELTLLNTSSISLETDINVSGPIHPELGDFNINGYELVLTSSIIDGDVKTGSIGEIKTTADVIGDITIQRHVESLEDGYRLFAPPIKNLSVQDIGDDFITTGFVGSDYPSHYFTNLKYYEEDNRPTGDVNSGYKDVLNSSDLLLENQGYWAYFPPSDVPNVLEAKGEFNKGEINYDLSYTDTGSPSDDGWHCVVNPYPSAIDISSACVEFNNVGSAIYILDHTVGGTWQGEYAIYNNGVSVNGGSKIIASFQAFMVQATGPGAYLKFDECAKSDEQGVFFKNQEEKEFVKFSINQNDLKYEAAVVFDSQATLGFDSELDGRKWSAEMFSLCTLMGDDSLSINAVPFDDNELHIPIIIDTPLAGDYELKIDQVQGLESNMCLFIEDVLSQEVFPVSENQMISFSTDSDNYYEERFILHAQKIAVISSTPAICSGKLSGAAHLELVNPEPSSIQWFDVAMNLIQADFGTESFLENVSAGTYYVKVLSDTSFCNETILEVHIEEGPPEVIEISSVPDYCNEGNASVKIVVEGAENWSVSLFDDFQHIGSDESSEAVEFSNLHGAIYDIVIETTCGHYEYSADLFDSNAVLSDFVLLNEITAESESTEVLLESLSQNANTVQWYVNDNFISDDELLLYTFENIGYHNVKLVSSNESCESILEKEILISAATAVEENLGSDFLTINKEYQLDILRANDKNYPIDITVYDSKGALVFQRLQSADNLIIISKENFSTGVYILSMKQGNDQVLTKKFIN